MHVENIDIFRLKEFETVGDADAEILQIIADIVRLGPDGRISTLCRVGIL